MLSDPAVCLQAGPASTRARKRAAGAASARCRSAAPLLGPALTQLPGPPAARNRWKSWEGNLHSRKPHSPCHKIQRDALLPKKSQALQVCLWKWILQTLRRSLLLAAVPLVVLPLFWAAYELSAGKHWCDIFLSLIPMQNLTE